MKMSKEAKIGLVSIVTIVLFIWLYNFLKGENLFTRTTSYYAVYDEIGGLSESNPIEVSGYKIGVVQGIEFIDDGSGRLLVTFSLNKNIRIPVGSEATITAASLIAGMKIVFAFSDSDQIYESGDTIPGKLDVGLLARVEDELLPLKDKISDLVVNLDSVIVAINQTLSYEFRSDLTGSVKNINTATRSMSRMLNEREDELSQTLSNLHKFSEVIAQNTPKIDSAIGNLAIISDSLAKADFAGTINRLGAAASQTANLLERLNQGEGTAGKLMTDDSLYINLTRSLDNLQSLLSDLEKNPKRYVNFSLFGRKND
jgi:phospholipid/cholesterol/gamma-HCH transport system substrate-binding protein